MNQEINTEELKGKGKEEIRDYLLQKGISEDIIKKIIWRLNWLDLYKKISIALLLGPATLLVLLMIFYPLLVNVLSIRNIVIALLLFLGLGLYTFWDSFIVYKKSQHEIIQKIILGKEWYEYTDVALKYSLKWVIRNILLGILALIVLFLIIVYWFGAFWAF